jgi:hypothetical protein
LLKAVPKLASRKFAVISFGAWLRFVYANVHSALKQKGRRERRPFSPLRVDYGTMIEKLTVFEKV